MKLLPFIILLLMALCSSATPLGKSRHRATHVPPERNRGLLRNLFVWPNSYYDVPRHRYPYYDASGTGKLLYGFGGRSLYKYSVFRPLEGYFKKK